MKVFVNSSICIVLYLQYVDLDKDLHNRGHHSIVRFPAHIISKKTIV